MQRVRGARVEVSLLKNDLEQLSAAPGSSASQQQYAQPSSSEQGQAGVSGAATTTPSQQQTAQPAQQPSSVNTPAGQQPQSQKPSPAIPPKN
jgi:hypothetical protein